MSFKAFVLMAALLAAASSVFAQQELQPLIEAQRSFEQSVIQKGMKAAYLEFLKDDAIVFEPGPVNGKVYWEWKQVDPSTQLERTLTYSDIDANGILGYTTGNWRTYQKGKSEGLAKFGQYVTIWERAPNGKFMASVDIAVTHDKLPFSETDTPILTKQTRDVNLRQWSPADTLTSFLRLSMTSDRLGGAYDKFAAPDVRILRDGAPPIIGKKLAVKAMNDYISVMFPRKYVLFQSADMAYTWNPCNFDNTSEGMVEGNCLHIWKLRKKKWYIVLGVFAPIPNMRKPELKTAPKKK
jgi:ketosteroid isomerase-like protein